jgi:hypothetical protein
MEDRFIDLDGRRIRLSDLERAEVLSGTNPLRAVARFKDGASLELEGQAAEDLARTFDMLPPPAAPEVQPVQPLENVGQQELVGMPSEPVPVDDPHSDE